jgi:hypothetical protein
MWTFNPTESRPDLSFQADKGIEVTIEVSNECVNDDNIALIWVLLYGLPSRSHAERPDSRSYKALWRPDSLHVPAM